ncbi:hypothetical protein DES36_11545 [Alkalibaculum bacchi]|uniref:Uncharacterized protein n=1 Tax=Alkalibaculum bacchi TaxID=645887 RepID=A0A366I134_9FIRM|nr:hypothetical protein [Alkalibaculum bacchi]RBP61046.1 hypothetical protein DES36_11545 [Alkalibaculum bacchi]
MDILKNIMIAIISGGFGIVLTHVFYKSKLRKEQEVRFQNTIGDNMAESLLAVRDIGLKASVVEIYDIDYILEEQKGEFDFSSNAQYPSIMTNREIFLGFHSELMSARRIYGKNLPRDVAAYIWYAEKYFGHLIGYLGSLDKIDLPTFGTIFLKDIQEWQISFDRMLVKRINSNPTKLELHSGIRWRIEKKKVLNKLWGKTILKKVINNEQDEYMDLVWEVINDITEDS